MPRYVIDCGSFPSVSGPGSISCSSASLVGESPTNIADLSANDIGDLSSAVLLFFVVCFCVKIFIRFLLSHSAGRS